MQNIQLIFLLIILFASGYAERPFLVEDSGVVEKGFELELSRLASTKGNAAEVEQGVVLNFAVAPAMQIGIEKGYLTMPYHPLGTMDTVLAYKYNFLPETLFKFSWKTIDGDEKNCFGNDFHEYNFLLGHDLLAEDLLIFSNLSYITHDKRIICHTKDIADEEVQNFIQLSAGFKKPIASNLFFCTEVNRLIVQENYLNREDSFWAGMLGLKYELETIAFDLAYRTIPESKDYYYILGSTFRF